MMIPKSIKIVAEATSKVVGVDIKLDNKKLSLIRSQCLQCSTDGSKHIIIRTWSPDRYLPCLMKLV